jgi:hypothetical protein
MAITSGFIGIHAIAGRRRRLSDPALLANGRIR